MAQYFLGVDGGQSSTTALIGDETGRVLGAGSGGPCNHIKSGDGRAKFVGAITACLAAALQEAGLPGPTEFEAAALGFSGGPADKEGILAEMLHARQRFVTHDALIALSGATAGAPGIIAIAGTGSISFGRNAAGKTGRAGGWGFVFGDEGGAFDLVRQALRATLRMEEGWGPATALRERLLEATGATAANDMLHRFYTVDWPRQRVATLARIVDDAAIAGDKVAGDLLNAAAQQLGGFTAAVRRMLFQPEERAIVAPIGGVFQSKLLRERYQNLVELTPGNVCAEPKYPPAAGALIEAYRVAGLTVELNGVPERLK
jgi:N-acetylglucosamine kinase-like BadF-type ATPase